MAAIDSMISCLPALALFAFACASSPVPAPAPAAPLPTVVIAPPAATTVQDAPAPTTQDASTDLEAELAWLRARVPSLAALQNGSPLEDLLAWVPVEETVKLWLTTGKYRCAPVEATRAQGAEQLTLSILDSETKSGGERARKLVGGYARKLLTYGASGSTQRQQANGRWVSDGGWGRSGGDIAGALREVGADRASFEGRAVYLQVDCPKVDTACNSGGSRPCRDCTAFEVRIHTLLMHGAFGMLGRKLPKATCKEPCPASDSTDMDRAKRLLDSLDTPWLDEPKPATSALHRSLGSCRAEP